MNGEKGRDCDRSTDDGGDHMNSHNNTTLEIKASIDRQNIRI